MTINGVGALDWASDAGSHLVHKRNTAPSPSDFVIKADTEDAAVASGESSSDKVDFSKLPADLVRILKQGNGTLPSSGDIARMVRDEQSISPLTGYAVFAWHEVTAGDKELIKATTGWDMFADPYGNTASQEALAFAGRLNLDRYSDSHYGSTSSLNGGEVTQAYISKLIQEHFSQQSGQALVPLSILYKAQSALPH